MTIGERLFSLRQKSGQSLQQVADKVGVSKPHVWDLEKGRSKNPSFELVRKLAEHYGVTIDVLMGASNEPDAEALKIERIHRGLEELDPRDREIVEEMIEKMKQTSRAGS